MKAKEQEFKFPMDSFISMNCLNHPLLNIAIEADDLDSDVPMAYIYSPGEHGEWCYIDTVDIDYVFENKIEIMTNIEASLYFSRGSVIK